MKTIQRVIIFINLTLFYCGSFAVSLGESSKEVGNGFHTFGLNQINHDLEQTDASQLSTATDNGEQGSSEIDWDRNLKTTEEEEDTDKSAEEDAEDDSEDEDQVDTEVSVTPSVTGHGAHLRPGSSRSSRNRPTPTNKLPASNKEFRDRPLVLPQKAVTKSDKTNYKDDVDIDDDRADSRNNRQRRLPSGSAVPSVQIIIVVVGAVLACVLITGFIRWRVRKRLRDRKLSKMAENLANYRGKADFSKKNAMATIYECECEDNFNLLRSHGNVDFKSSLQPQGESVLELEEMCFSHRFDRLASPTFSSHSDTYSHLPDCRHSRNDNDLVHGTKRSHKKHHGHRNRHSRHHRRKSHGSSNDHSRHETVPLKIAIQESASDCTVGVADLLEDKTTNEANNNDTQSSQQSSHVTSVPLLLSQNNPQPHSGVFNSLLHTWRSLSFNRDWVGKMWQERHNVRRLSDVLRGRTRNEDMDSEDSQSESPDTQNDADKQFTFLTSPAETSVFATLQATGENNLADSSCSSSNVDTLPDRTVTSLFNEVESYNDNQSSETFCDITESKDAIQGNGTTNVAEASESPQTDSFMSFINSHEEPPEYESLLDSGSFSASSFARSSGEHPRHHRRHRRKRSEGRERSNRHFLNSIQETDLNQTESQNPITENDYEELSSKTYAFTSQVPSSATPEHSNSQVAEPQMSLCLGDSGHEPNMGQNHYTSSTNSNSVCPVALPFVQQEGIVLQQLSDGSQIIYLPPPALPSYHNDTPPPYRK